MARPLGKRSVKVVLSLMILATEFPSMAFCGDGISQRPKGAFAEAPAATEQKEFPSSAGPVRSDFAEFVSDQISSLARELIIQSEEQGRAIQVKQAFDMASEFFSRSQRLLKMNVADERKLKSLTPKIPNPLYHEGECVARCGNRTGFIDIMFKPSDGGIKTSGQKPADDVIHR